MSKSVFGWSLPPGCGRLPGEEEDMLEAFEAVVELTSEEAEKLEDNTVCQLLDKMFNWAHKLGWSEAMSAEAEAKHYQEMGYLRERGD